MAEQGRRSELFCFCADDETSSDTFTSTYGRVVRILIVGPQDDSSKKAVAHDMKTGRRRYWARTRAASVESMVARQDSAAGNRILIFNVIPNRDLDAPRESSDWEAYARAASGAVVLVDGTKASIDDALRWTQKIKMLKDLPCALLVENAENVLEDASEGGAFDELGVENIQKRPVLSLLDTISNNKSASGFTTSRASPTPARSIPSSASSSAPPTATNSTTPTPASTPSSPRSTKPMAVAIAWEEPDLLVQKSPVATPSPVPASTLRAPTKLQAAPCNSNSNTTHSAVARRLSAR